jgi:hypothetical protein
MSQTSYRLEGGRRLKRMVGNTELYKVKMCFSEIHICMRLWKNREVNAKVELGISTRRRL